MRILLVRDVKRDNIPRSEAQGGLWVCSIGAPCCREEPTLSDSSGRSRAGGRAVVGREADSHRWRAELSRNRL